MIPLLRTAWIWTASAILILLWTPLLGVVRLFDREPRRLRTGRWFRKLGRVLAGVNPWRIHISGGENLHANQVYVVVSNHQSLADIPLISHLKLDTKWLAKAELFRVPLVGWMLRMAGDVPVERSDRRKSAKALLQCARYLRQHCSVVFFPEGTRSPDRRVLPFNEGPFQLAIREHIPILPLVVDGSGAALPRNSWIFGKTQDIYLRILEAVSVDGWSIKQVPALRDAVRQRIVDELDRLRRCGSPENRGRTGSAAPNKSRILTLLVCGIMAALYAMAGRDQRPGSLPTLPSPHAVHVIRHIVARVFAHRDLEARGGHELLHEIERAEFVAFAAGGAKVVGRDAHKPRAAERPLATGQRLPFGAFDVHLQEVDTLDAVLRGQIVESHALHRITRCAGIAGPHVVGLPYRQRFDLQFPCPVHARVIQRRHIRQPVELAQPAQRLE